MSWTEVKPPALLELPAIELDERKLLDEDKAIELEERKLLDEDKAIEDDERTDDTEERIDDEDERIDDEDERSDEESTDDALDLLVDTDELPPPQIAPVTIGASIAPLALTCRPNATVCPG